jgi:hypothetical protein
MTRIIALAAVAVTLVACNTSYTPRSPGRVFVTMENGMPAYVRDGEHHAHGFLGTGLKRAVRGNRQAEAAADEYHDRIRDGLLVALGGGVCMGVALGMSLHDAIGPNPESRNDDRAATEALVALGCMGVMIGGALYTATAEPYRWDAINIFNDNPPPMPMYGPPLYYGPGGSVEKPVKKRLGMRGD